jgi:HTH-type transcriptional regulator, bacterioopsin transcriptional activator and related proteins
MSAAMKATVVGEEKEIRKLLQHVGKSRVAPRILSLTRLEPKSDSSVSRLTAKQRQTLLAAYSSGYYEVPRRASSKELARLLRIDKSTFAEHLRKAERNVVKSVLEG